MTQEDTNSALWFVVSLTRIITKYHSEEFQQNRRCLKNEPQ